LEFQVGLAWIGAGGGALLGAAGDGRTIPSHLLPTQSTEVRGTRAEGGGPLQNGGEEFCSDVGQG